MHCTHLRFNARKTEFRSLWFDFHETRAFVVKVAKAQRRGSETVSKDRSFLLSSCYQEIRSNFYRNGWLDPCLAFLTISSFYTCKYFFVRHGCFSFSCGTVKSRPIPQDNFLPRYVLVRETHGMFSFTCCWRRLRSIRARICSFFVNGRGRWELLRRRGNVLDRDKSRGSTASLEFRLYAKIREISFISMTKL